MLVLSRMRDESIVVGGGDSGFPEIVITVVDIRGDKVRMGIEAPREVPVHRKEVHEAIQRENARQDVKVADSPSKPGRFHCPSHLWIEATSSVEYCVKCGARRLVPAETRDPA